MYNLALTLIGKINIINIIKSLMISKIIHILLSLPSPEEETVREIENIFLNFLWREKTHKLKLSTQEKMTSEDGLQFPNVRKIEIALKASWFKLIYKSCEGWAAFPNMYGLNNAYVYGNVYFKKLHTRVGNTFWADTPLALYTVYKCAKYYEKDSTLSIPLCYNQNVMEGKISNWSNKGLNTIGDLIEDGQILLIEVLKTLFKIIAISHFT